MGREIRYVKKGWEHPKNEFGKYQPMHQDFYENRMNEWIENHNLWLKGEHSDQKDNKDAKQYKYFAEWDGNPPKIAFYNKEKWTEKDEMWVQLYENVSEGSPLSPAFKTKKELAEYLIKNGDFWGYSWTENQANVFMEKEWCCSGMMTNKKFYKNQEQMDIL